MNTLTTSTSANKPSKSTDVLLDSAPSADDRSTLTQEILLIIPAVIISLLCCWAHVG